MIELKNFTALCPVENRMVLEWRNSINVRNYMYNSKKISLSEHLIFIEQLMFNKTKQYFLVKNQDLCIGVVYFNDIRDNEAEIGIYANPNLRGKGGVLMDVLLQHAFECLKLTKVNLEVFVDNLRAIQLYERFKFVKKSMKKINIKEVICMELSSENR